MEGEFQDQGQLDQELEEWLSPRGSQSVHGFFSEEEKQQSTQTENSAPEGAIISNQAPERETSTMVVVKWSDKVEGYGDDIFAPVRWIIQRRDGYIPLVRNRPRCKDERLHLVQRRY